MNSKKRYFPMFMDLTDKTVVVVGAGTIAKRRIRALADFTDDLVVVAPEVNNELKQMEAEGKIRIRKKHYEREDIYDAALVIAAASDKKVNNDIYTACKCLGIPVNVYSDKNKCDFYFPSLSVSDSLVVGLSDTSKDRKRIRQVSGQIDELLRTEN